MKIRWGLLHPTGQKLVTMETSDEGQYRVRVTVISLVSCSAAYTSGDVSYPMEGIALLLFLSKKQHSFI